MGESVKSIDFNIKNIGRLRQTSKELNLQTSNQLTSHANRLKPFFHLVRVHISVTLILTTKDQKQNGEPSISESKIANAKKKQRNFARNSKEQAV